MFKLSFGALLAPLLLATIMSPSASTAHSAEIIVYSTTSLKEALIDLAPEFEHHSPHKLKMNYGSGAALAKQIPTGVQGDLFIGPDDFVGPLTRQGALQEGTRVVIALSQTALAVRAGAVKPDISTPDKLKAALLAAKGVSYSAGASGIQFVKILETLGIADAVKAKLVPAKPGELIGAVVARGEADIGVQQVSELLPVAGIQILDPLPKEFQQAIHYSSSAFSNSKEPEAAKEFVKFLQSEQARKVLREKGLDPV
jgi:molybdate transport system substrate-binding protein